MNPDTIKKMVAALAEFDKDIPAFDRTRSRILEDLRQGEPGALAEFQRIIDQRGEMLAALKSLELALKNSAAAFARFEQKAAKDEKTLAEAKKKGGGSGFDDKHPILVAQRQAMSRTAQKLGFAATELQKLREVLRNKYATREFPELVKLANALRRDADALEWSPMVEMQKRLNNLANSHKMSG